MRIGIAQTNSVLGSFAENREKILQSILLAKSHGCDLVIFPELSLFGYYPADLLERPSIIAAQTHELKTLHAQMPKGISALIGVIRSKGELKFNSAAFMTRGKKIEFFDKTLLPTYDVFDEARHLQNGDMSKNILKFSGKKILITICEDIWAWPNVTNRFKYSTNPLLSVRGRPDLIINMSASPFFVGKEELRRKVVAKTAQHFKSPMIYVNMVGAQDEIIFDGGSFAVDRTGKVSTQCLFFSEDFTFVETAKKVKRLRPSVVEDSEKLRSALSLGIRDFVRKTGFKKVHLGLSGGIDSAVVACLACDALGPKQVTGISLVGPYTSKESQTLARDLAENLGIEFFEQEISSAYETINQQFSKLWPNLKFETSHENMQARLRSLFLMMFSNHEDSLLLATSNKSELAAGYATLYGDMCGSLMPIGDLLKGQVYLLAQYYNSQSEIIPSDIIEREPTAELRANQKDSDSLPPYDVLDQAVHNIVTLKEAATSKVEAWLVEKLQKSEFKRWQAAPILKVSPHSFGRGRRFPIAHQSKD